ncbi:MAG TPA: prolyl oligopeptidase family serine peptidase [Chitinophagaceae bacterium]
MKLKLVAAIFYATCLTSNAQNEYPATRQQPVTDDYFGKKITDNYRWMENMNDTAVQHWFKAQAEYTGNILNNIEGRDALLNDMINISNIKTVSVSDITIENNRYFYRKTFADENVSKIYYREGKDGKEVLLVEANDFSKDKNGSVAYFVPSHDGKKLAFGIAEAGVEIATIYMLDVDTKKLYNEKIFPSWFGINGWTNDNKGFLYTLQRSGKSDAKEMLLDTRVMYHIAGTDTANDKEIFSRRKYPQLNIQPEDLLFVNISDDGKHLVAMRSGVDADLHSYYAPASALLQAVIQWQPFTKPEDGITNIIFHKNDLYLLSHKNASNYEVLVTDAATHSVQKASVIIPQSKNTIEAIYPANDYLFIQYTDGINNTLQRFNYITRKTEAVKLPENGAISITGVSKKRNDITVRITSWKMPPVLYDYNAVADNFSTSIFNADAVYPGVDDIVVEEIEVPGHDGTMVPLSIFYNKSVKKDGSAPCILAGYGSYGITYHPFFAPFLLAAVNKGIVAAWAHVRGGGDNGENWHLAGFKQTKPNTWKDFIACAEYLEQHNYTSSKKLTGWGVSAGGITIGRAVTERPDLFAVAINEVGITNVLRFEATPNGPNNAKEFGTVKDSSEAMALIEMDALHHVQGNTKYPAVLCMTGMNDPRVIPWQPGKFAAALQQSSSSGKPVLLRVNYNTGHHNEDKIITFKNFADAISFALWQCGDPRFQPKSEAKSLSDEEKGLYELLLHD